jgi:small-conductance mechanosensitive channel
LARETELVRLVKLLKSGLLTVLAALCLMAPATPAFALLPSGSDTAEALSDPAADQSIQTSPEENADEKIAQRIRDIFGELPVFGDVSVAVSEGVVDLSGTVPDADAIDRAGNIAGRVSGVVTVENSLERNLSVEENLSILSRMSEFGKDFWGFVPLLLVAALVASAIGAVGYLIAGFTSFWNWVAPNRFLADLLRSAVRFVFVIGGLVIALDMVGAGALLGAVLGGAGVIGIALGFAMRDTIENYVASLMLSLRQPFRANDHVLIDDQEGRVIRLTSRATVLMTLDGNHLRIPNSQVFKAIILNFNRNPQRRFDFELGIDADDDPRAAMALGSEVLSNLPFVLNEPEPTARVEQVGDSNIGISFLGWIDQREADWNKSRSVAIAAVKQALEEAGFALPEPIYRLRFDGRTDPLPIGRSEELVEAAQGKVAQGKAAQNSSAQPKPKSSPVAPAGTHDDVRPESEIADMVDHERQTDAGQANDLLDNNRPVE